MAFLWGRDTAVVEDWWLLFSKNTDTATVILSEATNLLTQRLYIYYRLRKKEALLALGSHRVGRGGVNFCVHGTPSRVKWSWSGQEWLVTLWTSQRVVPCRGYAVLLVWDRHVIDSLCIPLAGTTELYGWDLCHMTVYGQLISCHNCRVVCHVYVSGKYEHT